MRKRHQRSKRVELMLYHINIINFKTLTNLNTTIVTQYAIADLLQKKSNAINNLEVNSFSTDYDRDVI